MKDLWRNGLPMYGNAMYTFVKRLQFVKYQLKKWNKLSFGNISRSKLEAQQRLDSITG